MKTEDATLIGKIYSASAATRSLFGDEKLLFSHGDYRDSLTDHPDWADAAPAYGAFWDFTWTERPANNQRYVCPYQ